MGERRAELRQNVHHDGSRASRLQGRRGAGRIRYNVGRQWPAASYDRGDRAKLGELAEELRTIGAEVDRLRKLHRANWFAENKPFGWEVIDIRYGGLSARLETARQRVADYLNGSAARIEELEEERLYYDAPWVMPAGALGRGAYHRIVTAGAFSG